MDSLNCLQVAILLLWASFRSLLPCWASDCTFFIGKTSMCYSHKITKLKYGDTVSINLHFSFLKYVTCMFLKFSFKLYFSTFLCLAFTPFSDVSHIFTYDIFSLLPHLFTYFFFFKYLAYLYLVIWQASDRSGLRMTTFQHSQIDSPGTE